MKSIRELAKAKVEFRIHLYVFIAVMGLLAFIDLSFSPGGIWFIWPLLGWGIGVVVHGLTVHYVPGKLSFKERMIEKEVKKFEVDPSD